MTADVVHLPRVAVPGSDLLPRLQASLRVMELRQEQAVTPAPQRLTAAQQRERVHIVLELAEALGVNLYVAAAMQGREP